LFVVCLISAALVRVSEINFAPGVGQKLLGLDAPMGLRKFILKFLDPCKFCGEFLDTPIQNHPAFPCA
jgi:hypothetical protein